MTRRSISRRSSCSPASSAWRTSSSSARAARVSASSVNSLPSRVASATMAETEGICAQSLIRHPSRRGSTHGVAIDRVPLGRGIAVDIAGESAAIDRKTGAAQGHSRMRSGREDLNLRPQRPERCALTGLRYSPHRSKIPQGTVPAIVLSAHASRLRTPADTDQCSAVVEPRCCCQQQHMLA